MNRRLYGLLTLALMLALGACATIDSSMLERAETMPQGTRKLGFYSGSHLMAHRFISEYHYPQYPGSDPADETVSSLGMRFSFGISDDTELFITSNLTNPLANARLGFKRRLTERDVYPAYAVMPTLHYSRGNDDGAHVIIAHGPSSDIKYVVTGVELPLLLTARIDKALALTVCAKGGYNIFRYRYGLNNEYSNPEYHHSYMGALIISPSWKFKGLTLTMPELGIYGFPVKEGDFHIQPTLNFGVSMEY